MPLLLLDSVSVNFAATFAGLLAFSGCCSASSSSESRSKAVKGSTSKMGVKRKDDNKLPRDIGT